MPDTNLEIDVDPPQPDVQQLKRINLEKQYLYLDDSNPGELQLRENSDFMQERSSYEDEGSECEKDSNVHCEVHPEARALKLKLPNITRWNTWWST